MNRFLKEKGDSTASSRRKNSVLDNLCWVHRFVKQCVCTPTIEEKPAEPQHHDADAHPHRTFFLEVWVRVFELFDSIGFEESDIISGYLAMLHHFLNLFHILNLVKFLELFSEEFLVFGLSGFGEKERDLNILEKVVTWASNHGPH